MPRPLIRDRNLHVVFGVTLMAVLGVASIAPALPTIARELKLTPQQVGLLITAFTVPGVFLTPVLGVLADRFGRKRILVPSLLLFGLAGGACALSSRYTVLLVLRLLQGAGAASLGSLNITLLGDLYSGHERAAAMGYNAGVLSLGTASYPALGGGLAQLGWPYPFLLAVLGVPVALWVLVSLRNPEPKREQSLRRYLGDVWRSIGRRQVLGIFAVSTITFVLLYGAYLIYLPLLMDRSFGSPPFVIGLLMSCSSLATAATASRLGRLSRRTRQANLIAAAFVLYAIALVMMPWIPQAIGLIAPVLIFGVAMGLNIPSLQTLLAGLAPTERRAAFMSLNGMVLRLGQTLGPPIMGTVYGWGGLKAVFHGGGLLALLTLLLVVVMLVRTGPGE